MLYTVEHVPNVPCDMQYRVVAEGEPNQHFGTLADAEMWAAVQYDGAHWPEDVGRASHAARQSLAYIAAWS